jgi:hypothetical protein
MKQFAVDVFYDAPLTMATDSPSISFYTTVMHLDYGLSYIRNNALINPSTGTANLANNSMGGVGNSFPQLAPAMSFTRS